jgi:hypothetical protein
MFLWTEMNLKILEMKWKRTRMRPFAHNFSARNNSLFRAEIYTINSYIIKRAEIYTINSYIIKRGSELHL